MIERYYIISLEAKDIYEQEKKGESNGFNFSSKKEKENYLKNLKKSKKNVLDNSLDLIELKKCYKRIYRNNRFSFDIDCNKYTLSIINLKFTRKHDEMNLKQLREYFYKNGFYFDNIHYVRYKRSSGSSREGKCLFIDEKLLNPMEKWGECGLKPTGDLASWESYKSLSLSSVKGTIDIPLDGILFIEDSKSKFFEEVVSVEENDGTLVATTKEVSIENDIWDGESLLDESLFTGDYKEKHMLLLRNKFFKSCAFKTKLQKWFHDKNITIEDLKAKKFITFATDINQIVMITTPNSMKFLKFMGKELTEENVRKWIEKIDNTFGVVKYDKRTRFFGGKMVQSSYQFINTLGLTEDQVEQLLKPSKDYIDKIRSDYDFMQYHFTNAYKKEDDNKNDDISDGLAERADVIFRLMGVNYKFKNTKLYINFKNDVIEDQKKRLKKGHILLPGTNATLFGNGPEMLLALSGEYDLHNNNNISTILSKEEIACSKFNNGEKLVCARSPHITMGNVYCVTNNLSNSIWEYFDLGENIVCVNAMGENIQQRLNGCDYDSDAMLITNDKIIVETAFRQKDIFKVPYCNIKENNNNLPLWELDYNTSENKVGDIVNKSQKLNSLLWDKINGGCDYDDVKEIYEDICKLAVLSGIEIDKAKRSYDNINVEKELEKFSKSYVQNKPKFFKIIDDDEIEKKVNKIYDKDKKVQKKLRDEKREELKAGNEYSDYKTAMEYVCNSIGKIDYRKNKEKKIEYKPISDMLKEPAKQSSSTVYGHRDKVIKICKEYNKEINSLYNKLKSSDDDEKEYIYNAITEAKDNRKKEVEKFLDEEYVLYLVIKELEKENGENWHLYAPLLDNNLFENMLKDSKEKMKEVVEVEDGEYSLYNFKFTKN